MADDTVGQLMNALGTVESNNNYAEGNAVSSASGRYQYLDSTWANYMGYRRAKDAPPAIQDAKARQDLTAKLAVYGGDVRKVAQSWFYPAGVGKDNLTPPGNNITMGQYADRVMKAMGRPVATTNGSTTNGSTSTTSTTTLPPHLVQSLSDIGQKLSSLVLFHQSGANSDSLGLSSLSPQQQSGLGDAFSVFGQAMDGAFASQPATADASATDPNTGSTTGYSQGVAPADVSAPTDTSPPPGVAPTPPPAEPDDIVHNYGKSRAI